MLGFCDGEFRVILDKICKVCIRAHLLQGPKGMGLILHVTLQELQVPKEFNLALIKNQHFICSSMVTHLFNTYILKSELDLIKSGTFQPETKCNELNKLVATRRKLINANSILLGNLKKETKN